MNYEEQRLITDKIKEEKVFYIDVKSFRNYDDDLRKHFTDYSGEEDFEIEISDEKYLSFTISAIDMEKFCVEDLLLYVDGEPKQLDENLERKITSAILKLVEASSESY